MLHGDGDMVYSDCFAVLSWGEPIVEYSYLTYGSLYGLYDLLSLNKLPLVGKRFAEMMNVCKSSVDSENSIICRCDLIQ